jgi:uncharacterized protein
MRFLVLFLTAFYTLSASAEGIPQPITPYISDFADLMSDEDETRITKDLSNLRDRTGVEMTVVTIEYVSDHGPYNSIEPFATALFNEWGVGNAETNNGILVLVARKERAMRIELGQGYEPIYDDIAKTVIDDYALPFFRKNNYAEGIESVSLETIKRIAEPFAQGSDPSELTPGAGQKSYLGHMIFAAFGIFIVFGRKIKSWMHSFKKCPTCGQRRLHVERETTIPATREKQGEEQIRTTCTNCDYIREERKDVLHHSQRKSSSSFGGGRSSGGGASGRW